MELRRTSVRRGGIVLLTALLLVGATSCSGGGTVVGQAPAATVNDTEISQQQLDDMLEAYRTLIKSEGAAAKAALAEQTASGQAQNTPEQLQAQIDQILKPYKATSSYTYPTEGAASQLTQLISREVYAQAVEAAGIKVTGEQRSTAKQNLTTQYKTFTKAPKILQDTYIEADAARIALQDAVPKELKDAVTAAATAYEKQLRQIYDSQPESFIQVCGRVLATADEASAKTALDRVKAGEDFAKVAGEVSLLAADAASQAQCYAPADISQAFGAAGAAAGRGDVLGPLANPAQDGTSQFLLLYVDTVDPTPYEQARATIAEQVPDQFSQAADEAVSAYIKKLLLASAHVVVDPRFGTWDKTSLSVTPPAVPVEPTTPKKTKATTTTSAPAVAGS